jgi:uncharacterized membrane protein YgcG
MKIEERNANKTIRIDKRFSVIIIVTLVIFMISGSTAAMSYAAPQTLPSCTDPTGQNLPCMMVISTLPPPPNALQCQETSGQLLPCSYATQNLNNGEQIVAITVYVPVSYVFTGYGPWTIVKQVVHETKTRIVQEPQKPSCERPDANAKTDLDKNLTTVDCDKNDANEHGKIKGCERPDANAKTDPDTDLKTINCDLGDANEHLKTPPPPSTCKDNTTCPYVNTTKPLASATIQPSNTSIPSSGGSGAGSTCVNNCTTGTPPPVDCTKNPTDPSCTQTLTPSTTTPTTKTCPDGSVIDASATCPTLSTIPNTPPPPSSSTPPPSPPSNNPSPPSDNGNPSGGSGSSNGGGSSGGGSTPSQPSTLS